jgi:hypothetical protein
VATVPNVAIFLADDAELLSRLCTCDACMAMYAKAGVVGWFYTDEDDVEAADVQRRPAGEAAAAGGGVGFARPGAPAAPGGSAGHAARSSVSGLPAATAASASSSASSSSEVPAPTPAGGAGAPAASGAASAAPPLAIPANFRTTYDQAMEEFGKLPVTKQLDMLHGYNDLSADLLAYLRRFADGGVVVTEDHIKSFFASFAATHRDKRRRTE